MQARRRHVVEPPKPGNVDRRKAFTDIMERLALGVVAVPITDTLAPHDVQTGPRGPSLKRRRQRTF